MKTVKTVTVNKATVNAKAINAAIKKAGGSRNYITKIVLGKSVRKISSSAFRNYKRVKTIEVRSKQLKTKSVRGSLKGSEVRQVLVKVGGKKANKTYVTKYKKIFTKKNAGRKVTVR